MNTATPEAFLAALRGALVEQGDRFREVWSRSLSSNKEFTGFVEEHLQSVVADRMGLVHRLTKHNARAFNRVDSIYYVPESIPTSIHDPCIQVVLEHENAPERDDGLDSEFAHLLPLVTPVRVIWTYAMPPVTRASLLEDVVAHTAIVPKATWRTPLVLVLGDRRWTRRSLSWCKLDAAIIASARSVPPEWMSIWSDH